MDERLWRVMQRHLGYSDEEMVVFRDNPRNKDVLSKAAALMDRIMVVEVVEAHGCNSRHRKGDRFFFDGAGNLLTERGPKKICVHALSPVGGLIFAANELLYAGVDPNEMRFRRTDCLDVGLGCGGWGKVVLELKVEPREALSGEA
jgi:uncharacterized repeat protein (TIGR04076 family)